jgi:hypothetical protein
MGGIYIFKQNEVPEHQLPVVPCELQNAIPIEFPFNAKMM